MQEEVVEIGINKLNLKDVFLVSVHGYNVGNQELNNLWSEGIAEREKSHDKFGELAE